MREPWPKERAGISDGEFARERSLLVIEVKTVLPILEGYVIAG